MLRHATAGGTARDPGDKARRSWHSAATAAAIVLVLATLVMVAGPAGAATGKSGLSAGPKVKPPVPGTFNAVSCTSSTSCVAVGSSGNSGTTFSLAEAWNGTAWTVQPTPTPSGGSNSAFLGVSCVSTGSCLAVGAYFDGVANGVLAESWNGTTWTIETVPLPTGALAGYLSGVSCSSASACIAVGTYADSSNTNQPLAEAWDGTSFAPQTVPLPALATTSTFDAVSCSPSPSVDCEAVGWNFLSGEGEIAMTLAEGWNGRKWSIQNTPIPNDASGGSYPTGVSCTKPRACTAVGQADNGSGVPTQGWAQVWNGTTWTNHTTKSPTGATFSTLSAVSCSAASSTTCTAVGYYSNGSEFLGFAESLKGANTATLQHTPEPAGSTSGGLNGVWCSSPAATCTSVGAITNSSFVSVTLAEGWNGLKWSIQKTPKP
jgi:hypothetical protein